MENCRERQRTAGRSKSIPGCSVPPCTLVLSSSVLDLQSPHPDLENRTQQKYPYSLYSTSFEYDPVPTSNKIPPLTAKNLYSRVLENVRSKSYMIKGKYVRSLSVKYTPICRGNTKMNLIALQRVGNCNKIPLDKLAKARIKKMPSNSIFQQVTIQ